MKRYSDCRVPGWVVMLRERTTDVESKRLRTCRDSASVVAAVQDRIAQEVTEVFYVLGLDGRSRILFLQEVARGGRHGLGVTVADIFRVACATSASAIVLVHNHPSGDPTPSLEDIDLTRKVREGGTVLGIPVVDHVVITPEGRHSSFIDLGLF